MPVRSLPATSRPGVLTPEERRTIGRILKVNHAGEYGAIRIYRAQLGIARWRASDLVPFLQETLTHEISHCRQFRNAMPVRQARPCAAMPLWGIGGSVLGLVTALMGRNAIMACTKAVEQTVHRHLEEQLHFLTARDEELRVMIAAIQVEEIEHLDHARCHLSPSLLSALIETVVNISTEAVILLSTQGASSRLHAAIALARRED